MASKKEIRVALDDVIGQIDMDWEALSGETVSEIGAGLLAQTKLAEAGEDAASVVAAIEAELAGADGPRSSKSKTIVRGAFVKAKSGLNAGPAGGARRFDEQAFMDGFNDLIGEGETEKALTHLLDFLPALQAAKLNRKEKLKHLTFAGRRLQHAGLGKYGIRKLKSKAQVAARIARRFGVPSKKMFVDFGCGAHEPLALSSYFYGNGFERCVSNDFLPISSPEYAALSMYDILSYMRNFPEAMPELEVEPDEFRRRLGGFDLEALFNGDFDGGLTGLDGDVSFRSCDVRNSGLEPNSVSYLVSFAVFEHVMENESVCQYLYDVTEPGGLQHHFIDLGDHRAYRHDGEFNRFSFLAEEHSAPNLNRLRASEHEEAFKAAGFEVLQKRVQRAEVPEHTRANMLPKFQEMALEDQEAFTVTLTLRKPG